MSPMNKNPQWVTTDLMSQVWRSLMYYANSETYKAPRIGGVLQGCPRGKTPTPDELTVEARDMLRTIREAQGLVPEPWLVTGADIPAPLLAEGLRDMLRGMSKTTTTQAALAKQLGVSPQYLCDVLQGSREPGPAVLDALGLRKEVTYVRAG